VHTTFSYKTFLENLATKSGSKPGLDRIRDLDRELGFPSRALRCIHVAGTNGKGSVTTKIAHGLTALGYKTALYTSPHISSFRERIQINGTCISEERIGEILQDVLKIGADCSFFEIMTMVAFIYFMQEKVDYAVIETGLGGTFDATNIIQSELSIITSLSLDHEKILGPSLKEIAHNKAGIIKAKVPVILADSAALPPIYEKAFEMQAPIYFMPKVEDWMDENRQLARKALSLLCPHIDSFCLDAMPPCRFEVIPMQGFTLLFDVAHNLDGMKKLFWRLEKVFPHRRVSVIFGMSRDKNIAEVASFIEERAEAIYLHEGDHPRLAPRSFMAAFFQNPESHFETFFAKARERQDLILITGSFFLMKDWKERFGFILPTDPLSLND
jgi:dihydrofolate synthase/folylpolyglutamate synthase